MVLSFIAPFKYSAAQQMTLFDSIECFETEHTLMCARHINDILSKYVGQLVHFILHVQRNNRNKA